MVILSRWPERFEEQARLMTRDAKRGGKGEDAMIDDDMLPPRSVPPSALKLYFSRFVFFSTNG